MAGRQRSPNPPHPVPSCAVALVRCSKDSQEHSVADQKGEIERWCQQHGHPLLRVFEDEGISGSKLDRPGLSALLEFVEQHPSKGVVVIWRRNRLARPDDPRDGLLLERRIERAGWQLHFLQGAQPSGNSLVDTLMATIEHHQAGEYLRGLAQDAVRGIVRRFQAGESTPGGRVPYGYAKRVIWRDGSEQTFSRTTHQRTIAAQSVRLVPGDTAEVAVVKRIFQRYLEGAGQATIARELNDDRIPSPTGGRWRGRCVAAMLCHPVYAGHLVLGRRCAGKVAGMTNGATSPRSAREAGRDVKKPRDEWLIRSDQHEPLVDPAVFARAQAEHASRWGSKRRRNRGQYPLSGLLYCQACGDSMSGSTASDRNIRQYRCCGYAHDHSCAPWRVTADGVELGVLRKLQQFLVPHADMTRLRDKVLAVLRRRVGQAGVGPDVVALEKELSSLEGKISQGTENLLLVRGKAAAELAAKLEELSERRRTIESKLGAAKVRSEGRSDVEAIADEVVELVKDLVSTSADASLATRRSVLRRAVARVEVRYETRRRGRQLRHEVVGGRLTPTPVLASILATGGRRGRVAHTSSRGGCAGSDGGT